MRLQSEPITSTHGLALLLKAARTLNDGDPLDVVLEEVASAAAKSVWRPPGETGAATVWKLRGSELLLEAEFGGTAPTVPPGLPVEGQFQEVLAARRTLLLGLRDVPADLRNRYGGRRWRRVAVAPLISYGKPFGLLSVAANAMPSLASRSSPLVTARRRCRPQSRMASGAHRSPIGCRPW